MTVYLPLPLECWNYKCVPSNLIVNILNSIPESGPTSDNEEEDDEEDGSYLHPSLFASKKSSRLEELMKVFISSLTRLCLHCQEIAIPLRLETQSLPYPMVQLYLFLSPRCLHFSVPCGDEAFVFLHACITGLTSKRWLFYYINSVGEDLEAVMFC